MNIIKRVDRMLSDNGFKIIYYNNMLNINNFVEIIDFNSDNIKISYSDGICLINGSNLCVSKMLDGEVMIEGKIMTISLS